MVDEALAAIAIDGDAERPVLVELDAFQLAAPGIHREAGLFADGDFGKPAPSPFAIARASATTASRWA